jgi:uncharacterized membrane protein
MEYPKKKIIFSLFIFFVFFPIISAVQVVEVNQTQTQPESQGFLGSMFGFLKNPIFWYIVIALVLITGFCVLMFFLIRWLIKYLKSQNDIFYMMKKDRTQLAKIHRRYNSNHWWKVEKNIPVRLVKKENDKLIISKPIGHHRGDYTTHEGNVILSLNLIGKKKWFIYPDTDLLLIINRNDIKIHQKNDKGEKIDFVFDNLPQAKDIVQFNENEILIFAESISKVGYFFIPVLKSKDGRIIDLSLPTFAMLKEVILGDFLYNQTSDFGILAKKSMEINPSVRAINKVGDNNANVDVQTGENQ